MKMFLKDLIEKNGDKLVHYTQGKKGKVYMSVFNYSKKYGGTYDSFRYYNDYYVELGGITIKESD